MRVRTLTLCNIANDLASLKANIRFLDVLHAHEQHQNMNNVPTATFPRDVNDLTAQIKS